jgi:putative transposase
MNVPQFAIGDGAMWFSTIWMKYILRHFSNAAVYTRQQIFLTLSQKTSQPKAKEAIHQIWQAETKINAEKAFKLFIETYQDKYPKATISLQRDREELLAFYDFPAKH